MSDIQDEVDDTSAVPDSGATGRESVPAEGALQHQAEGTSQERGRRRAVGAWSTAGSHKMTNNRRL